jgi:hypothetical protein
MENIDRVPENIKIYVQEIANRMKQGRAVVMVGSGFSKNATRCRQTDKKFLDWSQLGDIFYEKLYGKSPQNEEEPNYYQNVLKLASGVQHCFGRTTLERLLLDNLPDEEYEPSEIHEMLLRLNWTDIFTTNYDTLLERTRIKVFDRRYQVVVNKYDLVYSKYPRIIKLHGSFPSTRPFILTEEDYRRYPKESAVFVNTVQQSLIENVMCMVGFSGDDPNFLNWIGWIQDNLGKDAASKIYMVGVFDLKETEKRLYESRNIVLINMRDCVGIDAGQHGEGLKLFFQLLNELQESEKTVENYFGKRSSIWDLLADNNGDINENHDIQEKIDNIIDIWKHEREHYPGWMIMPYGRREEIEESVEQWGMLLQLLKQEKEFRNIGSLLYEFNWRRKQCLLPLDQKTAEIYKYYLHGRKKDILEKESSLPVLSQQDMELYLSLLCFLREQGELDEWSVWEASFSRYLLSEEQKECWYCEQAYRLFYGFEYNKLSKKLIEWPNQFKNGETVVHHAVLLCELGYFEKAIWLLKTKLNFIRGQMSDGIDYKNFSKEAYIITLLGNIEKYYRFVTFQDVREENDSYAHLRTLWSYGCNPEYERDYLMSKVANLHRSDKSSCMESGLDFYKESMQVIKFMGETGTTFRNSYLFRHGETYQDAVMEIAKSNPYLALVCILRFDNVMACQQVFGKKTLAYLSAEQVDFIIKTCVSACKRNIGYILETLGSEAAADKIWVDQMEGTQRAKEKSIVKALPQLCPAIIASVVVKASVEGKKQAIEFLSFALEHPELHFESLNLVMNAVGTSLTRDEMELFIDDFMKMPLGLEEPCVYLDLRKAPNNKDAINSPPDILSCGNEMTSEQLGSLNFRKMVFEIIAGVKFDEKNVVQGLDIPNRKTAAIVNYYKIMFGKEDYLGEAKKSWMGWFRKQIHGFTSGEIDCDDLRYEIECLLMELKFYHYNCSGRHVAWNVDEILEAIGLINKWAGYVRRGQEYKCAIKCGYMEGWYILCEILLEMIFHEDEKVQHGMIKEELCELDDSLREIDITFVAGSTFLEGIPEFSKEIYDTLVLKLLDDKRAFVEIGKIVGLYLIMKKGDVLLLKQFWDFILHLGEKYVLQMMYLKPIEVEVNDIYEKIS